MGVDKTFSRFYDLLDEGSGSKDGKMDGKKLAEAVKYMQKHIAEVRDDIIDAQKAIKDHFGQTDSKDKHLVEIMRMLTKALITSDRIGTKQGISQEEMANFFKTVQQSRGALKNYVTGASTSNAGNDGLTLTDRLKSLKQFQEKEEKRRKQEQDEFIKNNNSNFAQFAEKFYKEVSSNQFTHAGWKLALQGFLGPASPVLNVLDGMFDLDKQVETGLDKFKEKFFSKAKKDEEAAEEAHSDAEKQIEATAEAARVQNEQRRKNQASKDEEDKLWKHQLLQLLGMTGGKDGGKGIFGGAASMITSLFKKVGMGLGETFLGRLLLQSGKVLLSPIGKLFSGVFSLPGIAVMAAGAAGYAIGTAIYKWVIPDSLKGALDNAVGHLVDGIIQFIQHPIDSMFRPGANGQTGEGSFGVAPTVAGSRGLANLKGAGQGTMQSILAASKATGVDAGILATVASAESGLGQNNRNLRSSASGMFQFTDSTWLNYLNKYGSKYGVNTKGMNRNQLLALRGNKQLSGEMAGEYMKDAMNTMGSTNIDDIYLSYFLGANGAKKLKAGIANGATSLDQIFGARGAAQIVQANPQLRGKSPQQIVSWAHQVMSANAITNQQAADVANGKAVTPAAPPRVASTSASPMVNVHSGAPFKHAASAPPATMPQTLDGIPMYVDNAGLMILNTGGLV